MKEVRLFEKPETIKRLVAGLYVLVVLLLVLEVFVPKHQAFPWERYPFFYGVYGFIAYVSIVLASHFFLRKLLGRPEDYYDR
jgi:hypothetical protein